MASNWREELRVEWLLTRERIVEHIDRIRPPRIHAVGDEKAEGLRASLDKLEGWKTEIDELVIELLMNEIS